MFEKKNQNFASLGEFTISDKDKLNKHVDKNLQNKICTSALKLFVTNVFCLDCFCRYISMIRLKRNIQLDTYRSRRI